jgi:mono/diheme cytochrome c family protein
LFLALSLTASTAGVHRVLAADAPVVVAAQAEVVTVWDGVYTEEQARRGERVYAQECASCHHDDLRGEGAAPALVGPSFSFRWSDVSLDDLLTTTRTTMPQGAPGSLSTEVYLDIIGYLLKSNGVPAGKSELPQLRDELRRILVRDLPEKREP